MNGKLKPELEIRIVCEKKYTSPKGRNSYSRSAVFRYNDISQLYKVVQNSIKKKVDVEFERAMMSDSLRYNVLRRDGFRCVICGRLVLCQDLVQNKMRSSAGEAAGRCDTLSYKVSYSSGDI